MRNLVYFVLFNLINSSLHSQTSVSDLLNFAEKAESNKNYISALEYLNSAVAKEPENWDVYFKRADIYRSLGDTKNEIKDREILLIFLDKKFPLLDPAIIKIYNIFLSKETDRLVELYLEDKNFLKAKFYINQSLDITEKQGKEDPAAFIKRARCNRELGNEDLYELDLYNGIKIYERNIARKDIEGYQFLRLIHGYFNALIEAKDYKMIISTAIKYLNKDINPSKDEILLFSEHGLEEGCRAEFTSILYSLFIADLKLPGNRIEICSIYNRINLKWKIEKDILKNNCN